MRIYDRIKSYIFKSEYKVRKSKKALVKDADSVKNYVNNFMPISEYS